MTDPDWLDWALKGFEGFVSRVIRHEVSLTVEQKERLGRLVQQITWYLSKE